MRYGYQEELRKEQEEQEADRSDHRQAGRERAAGGKFEEQVITTSAALSTVGGRPSLAPFFDLHSIAVIGASRDPSKVGGSVLANLRSAGFPGRVIPINASSAVVQGLEACPSLLEVGGAVDLAVITVPAAEVLPALKDCDPCLSTCAPPTRRVRRRAGSKKQNGDRGQLERPGRS